MPHRTPEQTYIADLTRSWATGHAGPVRPPADLDPERFLGIIARQPAMQTLASCIATEALPDGERVRMAQALEVARRRSVMMLLELERILPALAEAGLRPVVLKGASLALTVYDRPENRWFVDLDLLVEPDRLDAAYDVLARLGYRFSESAAAGELYDRYHFHRILMSNQGVCVEVHWALTLPASVYRHDVDATRRAAVEIPLGEASFLAPGAVDQILHGVLQSIADGFSDLRRPLDLHLLDARLDDGERELLCARAGAANLAAGLWLQYHLREELLGAPMPEFVSLFCLPEGGLARVVSRLDVAGGCVVQRAHHDRGYGNLLHWLCVPRQLLPREVRRYIFPDMHGLVNAGMCRDGPVPAWKRWHLAVTRTLTTGRILGRWLRAAV